MKKVTGQVVVYVNVTCPYCEKYFDINTSVYDPDGKLDECIFGVYQEINDFQVKCPQCNLEFIVDDLEY